MFDLAIPNDNEEELVREYLKKKYKHVFFLYYVNKKKDLERFREILDYKGINLYLGVIIDVDDIKKSYQLMAEAFYNKEYFIDLVLVKAKDFDYNRRVIQKYFFNGLLNPGLIPKEDLPTVRFLGIPSNSLKLILKNRLSIVYSIKDTFYNERYLGRVLYNIKIFQKKEIPIIVGSFASIPDEVPNKLYLVAIKKVLGIRYDYKLVFKKFIIDQIRRIRRAKNPDIFMDGYEIVKYPYEDCREY